MRFRLGVLTAVVLLASFVRAQTGPRVTGVEPASGKVGDDLTITGENLGKDSVKAAFLSDTDKDYKGTLVEQTDGKIIMKIPEVKPGEYNISIQVGNNIFIQPIRFKVQS